MTRFCVKRRVQIEEEVYIQVAVPNFLTEPEDITFYIRKMVEADKTLNWNETARGNSHNFTVSVAPNGGEAPKTIDQIVSQETVDSYHAAREQQSRLWGLRFW